MQLYLFSGCNLSPLLFSLFINDLGSDLNKTGLGIDLQGINISAILFADDLVLIGKNRKSLDVLMGITRDFFSKHKLQISETKSKILTYNAATGKTSFNVADQPTINLDQVVIFKYLGIQLNCSPYNLFKSFNEQEGAAQPDKRLRRHNKLLW